MQVAQERTFIGQYVSGQLIALALGLCFAALGILPLSCHPYRTVYEGFLPLATALLLLEADLKRLTPFFPAVLKVMNGRSARVSGH